MNLHPARPILGIILCCSQIIQTGFAAELPYQDDPEVIKLLTDLPAGNSLLLPDVNVEAGGLTLYDVHKRGPGQRDYCNKMPYANDRQTALYAGGNHQVPHRMNDVWEYHLGSNTWHLIYAPDGGNPGKHKGAYFLTSRTLVREPDTKLNEKQQQQLADYGEWWKENVVLKDGHLATTNGGPIMPAHTWDAFTYDPIAGKLLWGMGANPAGQLSTHAYYTGKPIAALEKQSDSAYTPMWMFNVRTQKWEHYRTADKHAELRGMGASMTYLPDEKKSIWYVAAQNVSPAAFEMWLFDTKTNTWTELLPNGGKSISQLAGKDGIAPMSEVQMAYSSKHRKLVAVLKHDTFVYDLDENEWSKINTDESIYAHDAHSVFAYDSAADKFMLAFAPAGRGKELKLAAFDLDSAKWETLSPKGPAIPVTKYGMYMGYYDPFHNVFAVQGRYSNQFWVYRYGE
jgi:hypothetical protein